MTNRVKVLLFAGLRAKVGMGWITIDVNDSASVDDLRIAIATAYPEIEAEISRSLVAIDHEYAGSDSKIPSHAEIAIFPPVSGGEGNFSKPNYCWIQDDEINVSDLINKIITPSSGAIGMFVGVVRSITLSKEQYQTEYLTYEAYIPMAKLKMLQIASEIRERWADIEGIIIVQRCGTLTAGTPSVLIACSSAHRDDGIFEAARYGIDRLKEIVPIWKQETGPDGKIWIEGNYKPEPGE